MKRWIMTGLAALGVVGMFAGLGATSASAQDYYHGWRDMSGIRMDMQDIRSDNHAVGRDRAQLRRDYRHHDYAAVQADRRILRSDLRNRAVDRSNMGVYRHW